MLREAEKNVISNGAVNGGFELVAADGKTPMFFCGPTELIWRLFGSCDGSYWPVASSRFELKSKASVAIRNDEIGVQLGSTGEIVRDREEKMKLLEQYII